MADLFGDDDDDDILPEDGEEDILDMGDDMATEQPDVLLMRFCPHDSSMLYPQVCATAHNCAEIHIRLR